ncbi:patatin family protein [Shewanella sp. NIFS-20-20]|uniref:patatin-like phospholipase family protein n=1 Tax=Shewanella sp. NIFS-20-20 TaxID=2853806 RepID=UPI001C4398D5|nr:patatin family protein [Shewanella sp. NIFS-20-20]MBV7316074.1 patatin family protein [Shewanella sp. NIFS-20-20]
MLDAALVVEGGGLRSIYAAGVMDAFMEENIEFPYVSGVSAGAIYAASFISRQPQRNLNIQQQYLTDKRYMGLRHWLRTGNYVNTEFTFTRMTKELLPFDFKRFKAAATEFHVGAFDCVSGQMRYFTQADFTSPDDLIAALIASSSLPLLAQPQVIDSRAYLDGGLKEAITSRQAERAGFRQQVVILTRPPAYVKSPLSRLAAAAIHTLYRRYPNVAEALTTRHQYYQQDMALLRQKQLAGEVVIIQPHTALPIGRLEANVTKVEQVYQWGLKDGRRAIPQCESQFA